MGKTGRKHGRNKNSGGHKKWANNFNLGRGLKHRRMKRRTRELDKAAEARENRERREALRHEITE